MVAPTRKNISSADRTSRTLVYPLIYAIYVEDVLAGVYLIQSATFILHKLGNADHALLSLQLIRVLDASNGTFELIATLPLEVAKDSQFYSQEGAEQSGS